MIAMVTDVKSKVDKATMAAEMMIIMEAVSKVAGETIMEGETIAIKAVSNKVVEGMMAMAAGTAMANNKGATGTATAANPTTTIQEANPRTPATVEVEAEATEMMVI